MKKRSNKLYHFPSHNYPNWAWELKCLGLSGEMILANEQAICKIYIEDSEIGGKGLFAGKDFAKGLFLFLFQQEKQFVHTLGILLMKTQKIRDIT